jgi:hypothetical protein
MDNCPQIILIFLATGLQGVLPSVCKINSFSINSKIGKEEVDKVDGGGG